MKITHKFILAILIFTVAMGILTVYVPQKVYAIGTAVLPANATIDNTFTDTNLQSIIVDGLNSAEKVTTFTTSSSITQTDLDSITNLSTISLEISDATGVEYLYNLTSLDLSYDSLIAVPDLSAMTSLTSLDLSYNDLKTVPGLSALTNLTNLNLSNNYITTFSGLSNLTKLTGLDLSNNQLTTLPDLSALTQLNYLGLYINQLTDISDSNYAIINTLQADISFQNYTETLAAKATINTDYSLTALPIFTEYPTNEAPNVFTYTLTLPDGSTSTDTNFAVVGGEITIPAADLTQDGTYTFNANSVAVAPMLSGKLGRASGGNGGLLNTSTYALSFIANAQAQHTIIANAKPTVGGTVAFNNDTPAESDSFSGSTSTSASVTATAKTGYHFLNWDDPSGVIAGSDLTSTKVNVKIGSAAATITANFVADDTSNITPSDNGGNIIPFTSSLASSSSDTISSSSITNTSITSVNHTSSQDSLPNNPKTGSTAPFGAGLIIVFAGAMMLTSKSLNNLCFSVINISALNIYCAKGMSSIVPLLCLKINIYSKTVAAKVNYIFASHLRKLP